MSQYFNVYKASKLLNMLYPSSLTNRSAGLHLELLDSLESHIQSAAEVATFTCHFYPVPSCTSGASEHVGSSACIDKLHLPLALSGLCRRIRAVCIPCQTGSSLREQFQGEDRDPASGMRLCQGRIPMHLERVLGEGGVVHSVGSGEGHFKKN